MTDATKAPGKRLVGDPEVLALADLAEILDDLKDDARQRVLMWLVGRYAGAGFHASVSEPLPSGRPDPMENGHP